MLDVPLVLALLGLIIALASAVLFILGWHREEVLGICELMLRNRSESLFQSEDFRPSPCHEKIYLPDRPDRPCDIESISLRSGIEIKEYSSESFEIKPYTKKLLFVGWGVLKEKRYLGSLMDRGDIGQLFFLKRDKTELRHIAISLPATEKGSEKESCLKLADMRPSISGDPPDDLVEAMGLFRAKVDYIPWEDSLGEGFCNIWVSSIEVPNRTRHIKFKTYKGSMHITNLIAIRSLRKSEGKTINEEELKLDNILSECEGNANELLKEAEEQEGEKASKKFEEAAYLYKDEEKRKEILKRAGESLIKQIEEITEIDLQESKINARVTGTARVLFLAAIYLYQAKCLDKEYYKKISQYIEKLAEYFEKHDPPYLKEAFEYWFRMGWISLMYADQVETREGVIDAVNKAYDFYIRKIVEAILHLRHPSRSDIDYAIEMCKKMQRCYGEKHIDVPEVTELNEKLTALERTKEQFDLRSKIK